MPKYQQRNFSAALDLASTYQNRVRTASGVTFSDIDGVRAFLNGIEASAGIANCSFIGTFLSNQNVGTGTVVYAVKNESDGVMVNGDGWTTSGILCDTTTSRYFSFPFTHICSYASHFHLVCRMKLPAALVYDSGVMTLHKTDHDDWGAGGDDAECMNTDTYLNFIRAFRTGGGAYYVYPSTTEWPSIIVNAWIPFIFSGEGSTVKMRSGIGGDVEQTATSINTSSHSPNEIILGAMKDGSNAVGHPSKLTISSALIVHGALTDGQKDDVLAAMP